MSPSGATPVATGTVAVPAAPAWAAPAVAAGLLLWLLIVFAGVSEVGLINLDDPLYLTDNARVQQGLSWGNVAWAFVNDHKPYWHPLTWLSLMLDRNLFGGAVWGYHLTNLFWHGVAMLALFAALRAMTGALWRSALVAALFALHPLRVESVAWVAERKDVLCGALTLLAVWTYAGYVRRPSAWRYGGVLGLALLALLAKPMAVSLPALLLLLDYWPLRRPQATWASWRPLLGEKLPLLVLALACAGITVLLQARYGAMSALEQLSLGARLANACVSYVRYLGLLVWPHPLGVFYPLPAGGWAPGTVVSALALLAALTVLAAWQWRRRPWLLVGWLWYLGVLFPVSGVLQAGTQALADRFTYLPCLGLLVALSWSLPLPVSRVGRAAWAGLFLAVLAACSWQTQRQLELWRDEVTLYTHTLAITSANPVIHANLGSALATRGRFDEAIGQWREAVRLDPNRYNPYANLLVLLYRRGQLEEAIRYGETAVRLQPRQADLPAALGRALLARGREPEALAQFRVALQQQPESVERRLELVDALIARQAWTEALAELALLPAGSTPATVARAECRRSRIRAGQGEAAEAEASLARAAALAPGAAEVLQARARLLAAAGRPEAALSLLAAALRAEPGRADLQADLARALLALGRLDEAADHLREAAKLEPWAVAPRHELGALYERRGQSEQAASCYREALALRPDDPGLAAALARVAPRGPAP